MKDQGQDQDRKTTPGNKGGKSKSEAKKTPRKQNIQFIKEDILSFQFLKLIYKRAYEAVDSRLYAEAIQKAEGADDAPIKQKKKPTHKQVKEVIKEFIPTQDFLNGEEVCKLIYNCTESELRERLKSRKYYPPVDEWQIATLLSDNDVFGELPDEDDVLAKCLEVFGIIRKAAEKRLTPEEKKEIQDEIAVRSLQKIIKQYQNDHGLLDPNLLKKKSVDSQGDKNLGEREDRIDRTDLSDDHQEDEEDVIRKKEQSNQCRKLNEILSNRFHTAAQKLNAFRDQIQEYKEAHQPSGLLAHRHPGYDKFENFLRACSYVFVVPAVAVYLSQGSLWKRTSGEVMLDKGLDIIEKKYTR